MTTTVVGDPVRANARYYKKISDLGLDYRNLPPRLAGYSEICKVHSPDYVHRTNGGFSEEWVGRRPDLVVRAKESAGSALRAANSVWREDSRKVFIPGGGRPHAGYASSDRMCVYNDIAIAACWLQRRGWEVLVIDLDGLYAAPLAELLRPVPDITLVSIHEETASQRRVTDTASGVYNFDLQAYASNYEMLEYVDSANNVIYQTLPDVVLLNVGATGHVSDELTSLEYTLDGIYEAVVRISQTADELCASRLIAFGGVSSAGNDMASTLSAAATHAMSLPYLKSSAQRRAPRIETEKTA